MQILSENPQQLRKSAGAVVTRVAFIPGYSECFVAASKPGAGLEAWLVAGVESPRKLLGALVVVLAEDRKLVQPGVAAYRISEPVWPCAVCGAEVRQATLDAHMAERHGALRCPRCRAFISRAALEAHLREHQRDGRPKRKSMTTARPKVMRTEQEPVPAVLDAEGQTCPLGHGPVR